MNRTRTFLNVTATGLPVVAGVCDPGGAGLCSVLSISQTGPTREFTKLKSTGSGLTEPGYNLSGSAANARH
jgi:hypothetical protein